MSSSSYSFITAILLAFLVSGQLSAAPLNHLGQENSQLVQLIYQGDNNSVCPSGGGINARSFFRIWASGDRADSKFVVPAGKELVVTDVSWAAPWFVSGTRPVVGQSAILKLAIHIRNGTHKMVSFISSPVVITGENQSARIGTTEHMTAGFRVGPNRILCASVDNKAAGFDAGTLDPGNVYVYGYLISR